MQQQDQQPLHQNPYELMTQYSLKQEELCLAVAINHDNTLILCASSPSIQVFEFNNGASKLLQLLSEHQSRITVLQFFKKQSHFLSASLQQIIIWTQSQQLPQPQWICSQILEEHTSWISCLISNQNNDLIISGSSDNTIKFWNSSQNPKPTWQCQQTITDHTDWIYGLSISESQNTVVSCGGDSQIFVMESQNQQWIIKQKIKAAQWGYRICFINDNLFAFQPRAANHLLLYSFNTEQNAFSQVQSLPVDGSGDSCMYLSPPLYVPQKSILIIKNGFHFNVIKYNKQLPACEQLSFDSTIQFNSATNGCVYGSVSEDGQYLITWDHISNEIQIRKFKQIK